MEDIHLAPRSHTNCFTERRFSVRSRPPEVGTHTGASVPSVSTDPYPRIRTEELEARSLRSGAQLARYSKGRERPERDDDIRTCYQRDRDRIVHSKAFRRLGHKTQVFLAPEGDHYRVRLTHTLEVTQVARTIARALALNEDLVEAICLGHDLGHTPFGHLGEEVVAGFFPGFRHNLQSVRIVEVLEDLNLTWEVRDGIANHTWSMPMPATLEGQIARYADRVAYINHDIDDALRAGILTESELPPATLDVLGNSHSERVHTMVEDLVRTSSDDGSEIRMSAEISDAMLVTRSFLFERVYEGRVAPATRDAVERIIQTLLEHFTVEPVESPTDVDPRVAAVDYVAGMTDRFAIRRFEELVGGVFPGFGLLG
jgi:dGTPase